MFKTEPLYASTGTGNKTGKNLNNLLADDDEPQAEPPGLIQQILNFFSKLWSPSTSDAEKLGFSYIYAEDGSLLGEYPMEANPASPPPRGAQHIWLPTASGPMPIAVVGEGRQYAVHADHLNTPRRLTQEDGKVAWQWAYSAFGDEQPTTAANRFTSEATSPTTGSTSVPQVQYSLRYPGQYFDNETSLHYNYFRSYDSRTGRYTQGDPIGLDGGWNRFSYVAGNPLSGIDPWGLETCVLVTRNSFGFADHAALYLSQGGTNGASFLFDPSGSYARAHGGGTGDFLEGKHADMKKFAKFHRDSKVEKACKNTNREEEQELVNKIVELESPGIAQCAINVSYVLDGSRQFPGVRAGTFWPGNLFIAAKEK